MKKLGQIMNELGFRADASQASKEAFIKHLLRVSEGVHVMPPTEVELVAQQGSKVATLPTAQKRKLEDPQPIQLSFDFSSQKDDKDSA
ncbi:MAG: hypothetical protein KF789_10775 [Bdellovibrionaceae bacterium]|nr:hypothetical protein [Pseudobdellovibrionaceae bacterium]